MAYMNQEKKAKIATKLKEVVPKSWKYTLGVRHHSSIVMTIKSAPVDLSNGKGYVQVNTYYPDSYYSGKTLQTIRDIISALNEGNHDRSDIMTDYFDVGWYVDLNVGRWDKPFVVSA